MIRVSERQNPAAVLLIAGLYPLTAAAHYCPNLSYNSATALPGGGHQYRLTGTCHVDPTGLGHEKVQAAEEATVSWDGKNQAREEFVLKGDHVKWWTRIEYTCDGGDPWKNPKVPCQRTACTAVWGDNVIDKGSCSGPKLNKQPTTRDLVPALVKFTSPDPLAFYFINPGVDQITLPVNGAAYFQLGLRKDMAANISLFPDKLGNATIAATLTWTSPDKIVYSVWPGQTPALPSTMVLKGRTGYDFVSDAIPIAHGKFPKPGLWSVKACIDPGGFKGCTERKVVVAKPLAKPAQGPAMVRPITVPAAPGRTGNTAPDHRGRSLPQSTPHHVPPSPAQPTATGVPGSAGAANPRLNPQPEVPSARDALAPASPVLPAVQAPTRNPGVPTNPGSGQ